MTTFRDIWPSERLEREMCSDANRLYESVAAPETRRDCACHIFALLERVREVEKIIKAIREKHDHEHE